MNVRKIDAKDYFVYCAVTHPAFVQSAIGMTWIGGINGSAVA